MHVKPKTFVTCHKCDPRLPSLSHAHQPSEADLTPSPLPVFHWIPVGNITSLEACRNSQQGHTLVVDELGRPTYFIIALCSGL